jgi:hypothetical protein
MATTITDIQCARAYRVLDYFAYASHLETCFGRTVQREGIRSDITESSSCQMPQEAKTYPYEVEIDATLAAHLPSSINLASNSDLWENWLFHDEAYFRSYMQRDDSAAPAKNIYNHCALGVRSTQLPTSRGSQG